MGEIATPSALIFLEKRNLLCGMSVLENVVFDEHDRDVARIPCASSQPNNVILLPCDAPTCEQTEPGTISTAVTLFCFGMDLQRYWRFY
ncbi:phosphoenolpyruvate carboxykinase (ATP) [Ranunculus cassubicifolius]